MKHFFLHSICLFLLFACSQQSESMPSSEVEKSLEKEAEIYLEEGYEEISMEYEYPWMETSEEVEMIGGFQDKKESNKEKIQQTLNSAASQESVLENQKERSSERAFLESYSKQKVMEMFDLANLIKTEGKNDAMKNLAILELTNFFPEGDIVGLNNFLSMDRTTLQQLQLDSSFSEVSNGFQGNLIYTINQEKKYFTFVILEEETEEGNSLRFTLVK